MAKITMKGYEFEAVTVKDSFHRRAVQYQNKIISALKQLGLTEDDMDIPLEPMAIKRVPASASWYFEGYHLHMSYPSGAKYVDNLYVVMKVIELEVEQLIAGTKTPEQFILDFSEDKDVAEQRQEARKLLGLDENELDVAVIDKKYKDMAKELHPDMPNGDLAKFKAINRAHKILKRELT
jgi:hypothetical protein